MIAALKSLADLLQKLVDSFPARARPSVLLSLIVVAIGGLIGGWLIQQNHATAGLAVGIPIIAFGLLGLALSFKELLRDEPTQPEIVPDTEETATETLLKPGYKQLFGTVLIGIELQAEALTYGIITVPKSEDRAFPAEISVPFASEMPLPRLDTDAYYGKLCDVITEAALMNPYPRAHGIGIAIPGLVNPRTDRIVTAPEYFDDNEAIVSELARRLSQNEKVQRALGASQSATQTDIASRILIDNDVRCHTRDLLRTKIDADGWRNYAYVFVGKKGVAIGLVFDRRLYYGSRFRAGELGHATVHLATDIEESVLVSENGVERAERRIHPAPVCKCGKAGVHWEALITEQALSDLTERVAPGRAPIARLLESGGAAALATSEDSAIAYETVLGNYARYVAVGIANLINALDLDHAVFGGRLIGDLWRLRDLRFRDLVQDEVSRHTVREPPEDDFYDLAEVEGWRGAALLFHDAGFHALLAPGID